MLVDPTTKKRITTIPHLSAYRAWCSKLTGMELQAIKDELNARIGGSPIHTSSWMPGADWTGTVFEPIYTKACSLNEDAAAKMFGLILWDVVSDREEMWACGRYQKDGVDIEGMTYFRIESETCGS
jgi:hypothetical protein